MSVTILCRLCAQESDNYIRIFDDEGKNLDLLKKITQCLQILLFPDDALPKEVCKQCCFRLDETFKFHECCSQAQEILISLFNGKQPLSKSDLNTQIEMTVPPQENFNSDLNAAPDVRQLKSCNSELLSVENKALCQQVETYECRNDGNKISKSLTNLDKVPSDNNGNGEPRLRVLFQGSKNGDMNLCNTIVKHDRPQLSNANDNCQNGNDDTLDRDSDDYSGPEEVGGNGERVGVKSRRGERKGWFCYECSSILRTLPALRDHYMKEHNKQPVFKCVYCSKVYNRYRSYARHVKTHDDEKKHSCEVCGKRFAHKTILKSHRAVHSEERPYSCAQCGKTFKQFSSLFIHNKNHTTSQTKFPCTQCSKLFATKHSLMGHVKSHAGVRDFVCDICGKSFIAKSSFDYHLRTHEENKPHICNVCGKSFRTSKLLSKHATLHSGVKPHQCDVCGKQFRERSALREHNRIHTGAMPYACQYCGKLFRFKGILTVHLRQHTGERPYRCTECHRTFTNWANLNKHTKRRHKNTVQASDSLQQPTESTNNCQQSSMVDNEPNLTRNMVDNEPNLTHNMATVPHSTVVACETPSATLNACVNPSTVHNTCENSSTLHSACANPAAFSETYKMSDNSALVSSDAVYRTQHAVFIPLTDVGYYSSHELQFLNSNR